MTRSVSASGAATVLILLSGCSHSGGSDRLNASNRPPAFAIAEGRYPASPAVIASGFTESQAKIRLEDSGYNSISGLEKGASGNWHGTAAKNGVPVSVRVFGAQ